MASSRDPSASAARHRLSGRIVVSAVVALVMVVATGSTAHAQYGGTQGFVIDPPVVNIGGAVSFLGTGCEGESEVIFTVEQLGEEVGRATPDETGDFYLDEVVITLQPGVYPVTATCGDLSMVAQLTVLAEGEGIDSDGDGIPDALAFTGSGTQILKTGLALACLGLFLVLVARRRKDGEDAIATA